MGYKYNIIYNANGKIHKTNHSKTADFEIMEEIKGDIFTLTLLPKTDITFQKFAVTGDIHFHKTVSFLLTDTRVGPYQGNMRQMKICVLISIRNFYLFLIKRSLISEVFGAQATSLFINIRKKQGFFTDILMPTYETKMIFAFLHH